MEKPILYVMIGLPGCGKSYYATNKLNANVVSSDDIRELLYGDASIQGNPKEVFNYLHTVVDENLSKNIDTVYDATNIDIKNRKEIFERYKDKAKIIGIYFDVPVEVCKSRNVNRERTVPDYVYDRMVSRFVTPTLSEGFDDIIRITLKG